MIEDSIGKLLKLMMAIMMEFVKLFKLLNGWWIAIEL